MLKIWGRRNSFNVQKVMWLIGELELPHEHIPLGGSYGGLDKAEFLALNPHGRIPVVQDGETVVWESQAILRYLAARYGQGRFWSEDARERALIEEWMEWSQTALQPDFLNGVFWGFYRTPEKERNWEAINASIERSNKHFLLLNKHLEYRPFINGDSFSLADIPAGALLYRYFELEIKRPSLPRVEAWYQRLQTRPAYRQHVMVPFDEMKGRLSF